MHKIWQAEAVLELTGGQGGDVMATAQLSASLAAKNAAELLPLLPCIAPEEIKAEVITGDGSDQLVIRVSLMADNGGEDAAMLAAMTAGLTVARMKSGRLLRVSPLAAENADVAEVADPAHAMVSRPKARRSVAAGPRARRRPPIATPTTLMGEVAAPKKKPDGGTAQRESFRNFMVANHLRASEWAKSAGVPPAMIYAYLTGSAGMLSGDAAEKLARAAHVPVEDLFRGE